MARTTDIGGPLTTDAGTRKDRWYTERMGHDEPDNAAEMVARVRTQIAGGLLRITQHAQQQMFAEAFTLDDLVAAIGTGGLLEDYPDHRRGSCCLLGGQTESGRPMHVVCTTGHPVAIIITVYEPVPPKWATPTQRRPV